MKRLLLCITCVTLFNSLSISQDFQYGIRGGINLSNLRIAPELDPPSPSLRFGVHIGGLIRYSFSENLGAEVNLLYSSQGANDSEPGEYHISKFHYLNMPLLFRYEMDLGINFTLGPQIGLLAGGSLIEEEIGSGEQDVYKATNYFKPLDLSLSFGLGYELDMGLDLNLRYNLGLTDINDDVFGIALYEPIQTIKSSVIQVSCGFVIK